MKTIAAFKMPEMRLSDELMKTVAAFNTPEMRLSDELMKTVAAFKMPQVGLSDELLRSIASAKQHDLDEKSLPNTSTALTERAGDSKQEDIPKSDKIHLYSRSEFVEKVFFEAVRTRSASCQPTWLTPEVYAKRIQPLLYKQSCSAIASRLGVSRWYAGRVRKGYRPHPRHWHILAQLVDVSAGAG